MPRCSSRIARRLHDRRLSDLRLHLGRVERVADYYARRAGDEAGGDAVPGGRWLRLLVALHPLFAPHRGDRDALLLPSRRWGGLRADAPQRRTTADHAGAAASGRVSIKLWAVRLPSKATVAQRKGKTSDSSSLR